MNFEYLVWELHGCHYLQCSQGDWGCAVFVDKINETPDIRKIWQASFRAKRKLIKFLTIRKPT